MKNYKQLLKELPSRTVVFSFGRFNPPTIGHELLFKVIKKVAASNNADHVIVASKSQDAKKNPLTVEKKLHYLKLMFPGVNFIAANEQQRTFIEVAKALNKKYKSLIMVAGSDRVPEYQKLLQKYNGKEFNYDSIQVISAGERDPDADDASGMSASKMRAAAVAGDYATFKKGLPSAVRDLDGKLLMNDIRMGMKLEAIKEQVKFDIDSLREQYYRKQIFNVGDFVTVNESVYEILERGSNYVTVVDLEGNTSKKWIQECKATTHVIAEDVSVGYAPKEISFKGYTTKNLHHAPNAAKAFQDTIERVGAKDPVAVLNALKATDTYMKINDMHLEQGKEPDPKELELWRDAHSKAREWLIRLGEFMHHEDYWHMHEHEIQDMMGNYNPETAGADMNEELTVKTIKPTDKLKVARMIASFLGNDDAEKSSNPEQLVSNSLRKVKSKIVHPDSIDMLTKMLKLADDVGIAYDKNALPSKLKELHEPRVVPVNTKSTRNAAGDIMSYKDFKKLLAMNKGQIKEQTDTDNLDDEEDIHVIDVKGDDLDVKATTHTKVGHSMASPDNDTLRRMKVRYKTEETKPKKTPVKDDSYQLGLTNSKRFDAFFEESSSDDEVSEDDLKAMADQVNGFEDVLDAYDDDELAIIDSDTGEEIEKNLKEEVINEVLSRAERIRARVRFANTSSNRERKIQIALKRHSSAAVINKRARRLAVEMMKKKLAKKPLDKLSVGERERIEKIVEKRKKVIDRLAIRLAPKVRKIEQTRLAHGKYTKK